jgi:N12 class adenine-specific DNA methylase
VLRAQVDNQPWGAVQATLRAAYGAFVRAFGPINRTTTSRSTDAATGAVTETQRRLNLAPFADDPDCWLVASIEDYDPESGTARQGPVFSERVIHPPAEPVIVTAADALADIQPPLGYGRDGSTMKWRILQRHRPCPS